MTSKFWPLATLLVMSPIIGEYLLGSLPASMLGILPLMIAMYGAAAVLIRELARRRGGGWGSIVLLATAYGLLEEGFITQSLFNPNYLHLRLLDFGFWPLLGTALPWAIFVISIHVVWSITVPIALTESAFPARRDQPWLNATGLVICTLVFAAGCAMVAAFSYKQGQFMASPAQFGVIGALIAGLIIAALKLPVRRSAPAERQPRAVTLFFTSFLAGSAFMLLSREAESTLHFGPTLAVVTMLVIEAALLAFVVATTRGGSWDESRRFAFMAGAFMVYVWIGFMTDVSLHGRGDLLGHSVLAALCCGVLLAAQLSIDMPSTSPSRSNSTARM